MKRHITTISICTILAFAVTACATDEFGRRRPLTATEKGIMIGAATGAAVGYLAKKNKRSQGALLGAIGGGIAGGLVGRYMDNQKRDLEKVLASEVQSGAITITKIRNDALLVNMTAQTAFDFDRSTVKPGFYGTLDRISDVFVRYGKTYITVVGHTDNIGTKKYNQALSERRARAVRDYLSNKGVVEQRLGYLGKGESEPRASNATEEGRRLNRRVDIIVEPVVEQG